MAGRRGGQTAADRESARPPGWGQSRRPMRTGTHDLKTYTANTGHFERQPSAASLGVGPGRRVEGSRNHVPGADVLMSAERSDLQTRAEQTRACRSHGAEHDVGRRSKVCLRFRDT